LEWRNNPLQEELLYALVKGIDRFIEEDEEGQLAERPLHVIEII
jgi:5-methyltetrahydrofolate--homocysteine methyltransferase